MTSNEEFYSPREVHNKSTERISSGREAVNKSAFTSSLHSDTGLLQERDTVATGAETQKNMESLMH